MKRSILLSLFAGACLLIAVVGLAALADQRAAAVGPELATPTQAQAAAVAPDADPGEPAAVPVCDCNTSVGACPSANQRCVDCPCVSLDATKNGVCK